MLSFFYSHLLVWIAANTIRNCFSIERDLSRKINAVAYVRVHLLSISQNTIQIIAHVLAQGGKHSWLPDLKKPHRIELLVITCMYSSCKNNSDWLSLKLMDCTIH
uniref:Secreted protein n=1 Tax=Salix viminalis TaxID=40686 RepID=A0A6N2NCN4_SALVM